MIALYAIRSSLAWVVCPVECKSILPFAMYVHKTNIEFSLILSSSLNICLHYLHLHYVLFSSGKTHGEITLLLLCFKKILPMYICMFRYACIMVLQFLRIIGMKGEEMWSQLKLLWPQLL